MKVLNNICIGLLSLLSLAACDFLDETAYNKVTVGNFYTTQEGITNGVNGLYSTLRGMYIQEYLIYMCEGPSDLWIGHTGHEQWYNWTIDATNDDVRGFWYHCYKSINQCNAVIESLESQEIPGLEESLKERFRAEALFIRAHYFYHLVQQAQRRSGRRYWLIWNLPCRPCRRATRLPTSDTLANMPPCTSCRGSISR